MNVDVNRNELLQRLEKLHQDMVDRNDHDEAFLLGITISAVRSSGSTAAGGAAGAGAAWQKCQCCCRREVVQFWGAGGGGGGARF